jgi:hypothetical protein
VDIPVNAIARRLRVAPEQVLLAWTKAKGAVVVTYVVPSLTLSRTLSCLCRRPWLVGGKPRQRLTVGHLPEVVCLADFLLLLGSRKQSNSGI